MGRAGWYNTLEVGTDESKTWGQSADANFTVMDMTGLGAINHQQRRTSTKSHQPEPRYCVIARWPVLMLVKMKRPLVELMQFPALSYP